MSDAVPLKMMLVLKEAHHALGHHSYDYWEEDGLRGIRLSFTRLYEDKLGIWCEATAHSIYTDRNEQPVEPMELLSPRRTNLLGKWEAIGKHIESVTDQLYYLDDLVDDCVKTTVREHRKGEAPSLMPDIWHDTKMEDVFLLPPFVVKDGVSVMFGTGGTGKSTFAAAISIAVAGWQPIWGQFPTAKGNVLYLDWESKATPFWRNTFGVLKGFDLKREHLEHDIVHQEMNGRVVTEIHKMRGMVKDYDAALVVVDSIAMGRGGDAMGPDDTIALFRALNSLGVPVLALDHVTKEDNRGGKLLTPFGSQFTENSARNLWGMREIEEDSTSLNRVLELVNTKNNVTARHADMSLTIHYDNNDDNLTDIIKMDIGEAVIVPKKSSSVDAVCRVMEDEPYRWFTLRELQTRTGADFKALEKAMQRNSDKFEKRKTGNTNYYRPSWVAARESEDSA